MCVRPCGLRGQAAWIVPHGFVARLSACVRTVGAHAETARHRLSAGSQWRVGVAHRYGDLIRVEIEPVATPDHGAPRAFTGRGVRYPVAELLGRWHLQDA